MGSVNSLLRDATPQSEGKSARIIYVECTHASSVDYVTGVQRVVRSIIKHLDDVKSVLGVTVKPVVFEKGSFFLLHNSSIGDKDTKLPFFSKRNIVNTIVPFLQYFAEFVRLSSKISSLVSFLPAGVKGNSIRHSLERFIDNTAHSIWNISYPQVDFAKGDILFLMDASWHYSISRKVASLKSQGVYIGVMFHDLFPVTWPQFCHEDLIHSFKVWLKDVVVLCDFIICITKSVSEELESYLQEHYEIAHKQYIDYSYHGSDFMRDCNVQVSFENVRSDLKEVFFCPQGENVYLMVGTIEPRKNHEFALNSFFRMWKDGKNSRLCIAGKVGWKCEQLIEQIESSSFLGERLFMFNDLDDLELQYAYSRSAALIFPSHAEGFGLPIIEALSNNLMVFASDIPVHREVGGSYCSYFDINDSASFKNLA